MTYYEADFSDEIIGKGRALLRDGKVRRDEDHPYEIFWVPASAGDVEYRVQVGHSEDDWSTLTYVTCTCPHGLNKGGGNTRCYHAAAVLMLMDAERERRRQG